MEFSLTIISAVMIFVLGQISLKLIIEPIQELKKEISEILNAMVFYADRISNPNDVIDEVSKILRKHASNLEAKSSIIPFYRIFEIFRVLPTKQNISEAKSHLVGLSNSLSNSGNNNGMNNSTKNDNIKRLLTTYSNSAWFEFIIVIFIISLIVMLVKITINDAVELYCEDIISEKVIK